MAILVLLDASDDQLATYDAIAARLVEMGQAHPPGRLYHAVGRKGSGFVVADVWESEEALRDWNRLVGPMMHGLRTTAVTPPELLPVHHLIPGP